MSNTSKFSRRDFLKNMFAGTGLVLGHRYLSTSSLVEAATGGFVPPAPLAAADPNPVVIENAKPGTTNWRLTNPAINREIEGYTSLTSVNRGGQISFFVHTNEANYTIEIFRMGWYGGTGARQVMSAVQRAGIAQPMPTMDSTTGLTECRWTNPYVLSIPNTADPTDWMSGVYLAKLSAGTTGKQSYMIFVVRDDARASDLLFQSSVTTWQAYNNWGGKSLYGHNSTNGEQARKVSFNRPYAFGMQPTAAPGVGAGEFLTNGQPDYETEAGAWEYNMTRFLEREGYDVTYCTNLDTHENANLLNTHKGFLSVGHDEYWSWQMRMSVEAARDRGINLGFFSANTCFWQIRFEPSTANGAANRTMVCYKDVTLDPYWTDSDPTNNQRTTVLWRSLEIGLAEDAMIGVTYARDAVDADLVVENAAHWVYAGTGLSNGSKVPRIVGYEVDSIAWSTPPGLQRIAHSPFTSKLGPTGFSDMTTYTAASGATIFATGTIQWSWGLDDYGVPELHASRLHPAVQQMTRNVLQRFIGTPQSTALPSPWAQLDIGNVSLTGSGIYTGGSFIVKGNGADIWGVADAFHFVYQPLNGDGQITARVAAMENTYAWAKAGVMIRESLSAGSRHAIMALTPGAGSAFQRRVTTGDISLHTSGGATYAPAWVRLVRSGNTISAYQSNDGASWTLVDTETISMANSVYIGLAVTSTNTGLLCTTTFDNVVVSGSGTPANSPPAVNITAPSNGANFAAPANIALAAAALDTDGTISKVEFYQGATLLGTATSSPYNFTWSNAPAGNYTLTAKAYDDKGAVTTSSPVAIIVSSGALPSPWGEQDIGLVPLAGSATFAGGVFSVKGNGRDIWGTDDAFHFVSQALNGDGQITARVASVQNSFEWAKAGVMIRENFASDSRNALMAMTAGAGTAFQQRLNPAGEITQETGGGFNSAPYWVRLVRSGNTFSAYQSSNGATWTLVGSQVINMASSVYAGLAVTSTNEAALCTAAFDNVAVSGSTGNTPPTVSLTSPVNGASFTAPASITIDAAASDSNGTVTKVEFYRGTTLMGTATSSPYRFIWSNATAGSYSLTAKAYDDAGAVTTSSPVNITVSSSASVPDAPSGLTALAASNSRIDLSWTDNASNESGFRIERSADGVTFTQIATVGADTTSYASTGLQAYKTYYYRIRAYNASGTSAYSNTASARTRLR